MWWIDVFSTYLYGLKLLVGVLAILLFISGLDDLIIDAVYWTRRVWRALTIYRTHPPMDSRTLYGPAEKPLAVMVPAWQETGVIGRMAELAASTLDYENYHIFVGTYPNDPDTQRDVDQVCARFRNVHKVVCARPGPTSKADCLNNVLDAIFQFERRAGLRFEGFVLHDAEDVISPMELRLFNYLVARKDLIQVPVYPFERHWTSLTSAHYLDEFAELHGKDIPVREALAGQVPSAGVGTCFSRRAIVALLADGDGIAFDVQSLTEDYDIGFRLQAKGMKEIFVRLPAASEYPAAGPDRNARASDIICVREYFPDTLGAAIRQKSRWITGIVYQGFRTHGWTRDGWLNYFLWRDRKGAITNFVSFLASLLLLQLLLLWAYQTLVPNSYKFLSIIAEDRWLAVLLLANLALMSNRILQRVIFVSGYYGLTQGLLSVPRLFWGNFINFMANWRAISLIIRSGSSRRVAWDKTTHDFPSLGEPSRARRPLGRILIEQGVLDEDQLSAALTRPVRGLRLGSTLVHRGVISAEQLAAALAEQSRVPWESVDAFTLERDLIDRLPGKLALRYAVLPLREEDETLVVASEGDLDPVSIAALARKLARPVRYVIVPKGRVTVGLRHWYLPSGIPSLRDRLDAAVREGRLTAAEAVAVWEEYVSRQVLFAEILMALGQIDAAALNALLLNHERSPTRLGEFLIEQGVISSATLDEALRLQQSLQVSMTALLDRRAPACPTPVTEALAG